MSISWEEDAPKPFEVYPSDSVTTWKLLCDHCSKRFPPKKVRSIRVIHTEFQLCSACYAAFRRAVRG